MALSIGELVGYIGLDAGPFESGLADAFSALGDKKWTVAAGAAGAAAGAALGVGLAGAIEMDTATRKMNAGLGLTGADAEKAGAVAGSLYSQAYGESMEDVTNATGAVMSSIAGMRTASEADLERITAKAMDLATAFDVDVAEATATAGSLIKNGLAADADEAMDLLVGSMQKVPQALQGEMLPIMDEYGKHFAALGIDGETAMGIIVASSADGAIGMDKMGDALKEFTIRGTDMSKSTSAAYEAMGLNTEKMTNDLLAGGDTAEGAMAKIVHGLQSIEDPGEQAAAAVALFGTPLEDLGTDQIPNFLGMIDPLGDSFESTAGAAEAMGEELNGGPGVALEEFKRTMQTSLMDTAAAALPYLEPLVALFSEWAPFIGPVAVGIGALAAAIWVIQGAIAAYNVVAGIAAAVTAAWSWPIVLIIAGIAALVAAVWLIVANWDQVSAWLTTAIGGFANWWNGIWTQVSAWFAGVWSGLVAWASAGWAALTAWLSAALAGFLGWWSGIWAGIVEVAAGIWQILSTVISTAWTVIKTLIATGLAVLIALFTGKWGEIGGIFASAWAKISGLISAGAAAIWAILSGWIASIGAFLAAGWASVVSTATNLWNSLVSFIASIPGRVMAGLAALGQLAGKVGAWVASAKDAAVNKFGELVNWVKGVPGRILDALGNLGDLLGNAGDQIMGGFLNGLKAGWEHVKGFVGGIGEWIAANKGPKAYDLALLVPAGGWIMSGLQKGIEASMPSLGATLGDVSWMIANGIDPELTGSGSYAFTGAGAGLSSGAPEGRPINIKIDVTEATNAKETARYTVSKLRQQFAAQGVHIGQISFD